MVRAAVETVANVAVPIAVHPVGHTVTIADPGLCLFSISRRLGLVGRGPASGRWPDGGRCASGRAVVATAMKKGSAAAVDGLRGTCGGTPAQGRDPTDVVPFVQEVVEPGAHVRTDGSAAYRALGELGYTHQRTVMLGSGVPAHVSMAGVHRVASLVQRGAGDAPRVRAARAPGRLSR